MYFIHKCKECVYYYNTGEYRVNARFTEAQNPFEKDDKNLFSYERLQLCKETGLKMCQNPICFKEVVSHCPIEGESKQIVRISGQGLLNWNGKCNYFKKKTFLDYLKFWRYL